MHTESDSGHNMCEKSSAAPMGSCSSMLRFLLECLLFGTAEGAGARLAGEGLATRAFKVPLFAFGSAEMDVTLESTERAMRDAAGNIVDRILTGQGLFERG